MAKTIQTLNIGAANVALAEYELGAKGAVKLLKYGVAELASPLDGGNVETILAPALREIIGAKGFKPGKLALAISGQMTFPKFASIPMVGGAEKFEQLVRYEIEQGIPFPIDEMVCDRQVLGDAENGDKSVMIVAAKVDQIEAITSALTGLGFSPDYVDVSPLAITNALKFNRPDEAEACTIVLDIGARTTSLVVVEGDKLYNRSIPIAGNAITKEISGALGCSLEEAEALKREKGYVAEGGVTEDADEIVDRVSKACRAVMTRLHAEISRSINFYRSQQHGNAPVKLYLTGGSALLPQIDRFFAESLGIEVEYLNPFEKTAFGALDVSALENDSPIIASTVGIALHVAGAARFAINLLPPSIIADRAERARIPYLVAGGAMMALALVAVMMTYHREATTIAAQRDAVATTVSALSAVDREITAAAKELDAAKSEATALKDLMLSRSAAVQRLNAVREALLPGMWIEKWSNDGRITIRSWSDRVKGANGKTVSETVVEKLKGKSAIDSTSIKIVEQVRLGKGGELEQFTVEVKFK